MDSYTIIGAGGIGCAVGYALRAAGSRVLFVDVAAEKIAWASENGVGVDRHQSFPAEFRHFSAWQPESGQTILLCTKCYDNQSVLGKVPTGATLIPIQNGFDRQLECCPTHPEGISSFVSECIPGRTHTRITRAGKLHLGLRRTQAPDDGTDTAWGATVRLAEALRKSQLFRTEVVSDILPFKYSKLMYNAAIGPLASVAGLDNGSLLSLPKARRLFFDLLRENYDILHQAGVQLGKIGPFHPATVNRILKRRFVSRLLSWPFYPSLRGTYCSMHADLPAGRTEIDNYNGHLIEMSGRTGCPLNLRIYELVKKMEREHLQPEIARLSQLPA